MDEWGVFGVIAAIITFGVCVGAPLLRLNSTITELKTVLDMLRKQFEKQCQDNEKDHNALWDRADQAAEKLGEHETRITVLENQKV
jgi:hypothetical protein